MLSTRVHLRSIETISKVMCGIAFGDACGLPWEGLSARMIPQDSNAVFDLSNRMVSDDTEHALLVLASLNDSVPFEQAIRERFRRWILGFPPSLGGATLRAGVRTLLGYSSPGVRSQGNGPLTRAAILGASVLDPIMRAKMVNISTFLTHKDPVVYACSQMTAEIVAARIEKRDIRLHPGLGEWMASIESALNRAPLLDVMLCLYRLPNDGISGHAPVTLAIALQRSIVHQSVEDAVISTVALGGDVDSAAALAGAFAGASGSHPPDNWEKKLNDPLWAIIAPRILAGGDWPSDLQFIRKRNFQQLGWIIKLMFGMRLRARFQR